MWEGSSPRHREGVSGQSMAKANQLREGNSLFLPGWTVSVQEQSAVPSSGYKHGANGCDQLWSFSPLTEKVFLVCNESSLVSGPLRGKTCSPTCPL